MLPKRNSTETFTRYIFKGPLQTHTADAKGLTTCPPLWSYVLDMQQLPGSPSIGVTHFHSLFLLTIKVFICHLPTIPLGAAPRELLNTERHIPRLGSWDTLPWKLVSTKPLGLPTNAPGRAGRLASPL